MAIVVIIVGFIWGRAVVFVVTYGAVLIQVLSLVSFNKLTILKAVVVLAIVVITVVTVATDKVLFVVIAMDFIVVIIVAVAWGSAVVFVVTDGAVFIQVLSLVSFIKLTILKARQFFLIIFWPEIKKEWKGVSVLLVLLSPFRGQDYKTFFHGP
jgi:hypothetical protein